METLFRDIRYGIRNLVKRPGFTAIALLTLALGIGANSTIFSLVNATLMQRLPVMNQESLVYIFNATPGNLFSYPDFAELRDQSQVFDGMTAWGGISASVNSNDRTDLENGAIVTGNFFQVLGVQPALGRLISPEDDKTPGAHPVTVISHSLWQRRFGGDPNIVGQQLVLNGQSFTIIGVTQAGFNGAQLGNIRNLYVPMMMQAIMRPPRAGYSGEKDPDLLKVRRNRWLYSIGRLKNGVTAQQAQASLAAIAAQQEQAYPDSNRGRTVGVFALSGGDNPTTLAQMSSVATLLMSVVGVVLLIACANVANLLLARGASRSKEIAVRLAIGANRWRIVRQLLTESVLLAVFGAILGLLLAWWTVAALKAAPPPPGVLPIAPDFAIDAPVLLFTFGLSLLAAIVFGLAPALRSSHQELVPALKDDTAPGERGRRFNLRSALVVTQVALSLVLLIAAGLFVRSLRTAQAIEPGFDAEKVVTVPLNINLLRYTSAQGREFYRQVIERVESLPGVESATLARIVALSGGSSVRSLLIEGKPGPANRSSSEGAGGASGDANSTNSNVVGPKYFQTLGIAFVRGRDFDSQDTADRPRVIIVNEAFARRHFPNEEVLGRRVSFGGEAGPWQEIVGVVRDSKYLTIGEPPTAVTYLPLQQNHETGMALHVRSTNPSSTAAAIRNEVQSLERNLPIGNPALMSELISNSLYAARMGAVLLGVFGLLALLLAAVGLYGVMSFSVSRRTRELGIRMALGARAADVFRLVLRQGMVLVIAGIVVGLAVAAMVTRLLTSFLYGISAMDTVTFASIPLMLAVVALAACYLPARKATKVDPLVALRYE